MVDASLRSEILMIFEDKFVGRPVKIGKSAKH